MHIDTVSIPVSDQYRARMFYEEVLGFRVLRDRPIGSGARWLQLAPPGSSTCISLVTWHEQMPPGCQQGLVLGTDDIETDHQVLRSQGVDISDICTAPWGQFATFSDPDGNGWVLAQAESGPYFRHL